MTHWLAHYLGLTSPDLAPYLWWSGIAASIPDVAALAFVWAWWDRRKCALCVRIAQHPVRDTAWATCHRHLSAAGHDALRVDYAQRWPAQSAMLSTPDQPEPPAGQ